MKSQLISRARQWAPEGPTIVTWEKRKIKFKVRREKIKLHGQKTKRNILGQYHNQNHCAEICTFKPKKSQVVVIRPEFYHCHLIDE